MTTEEYKATLQEALSELQSLFYQNPHLFLTEEDVRCILYHLLFVRLAHTFVRLKDGSLSSPIHSEVRWYGRNQDKHKRSDIVILDTSDLRVTDEGFQLPTKGYGFNNFYAVVEIKLRRSNSRKSDDIWLNEIKDDLDTLRFLRTGVDNDHDPLLVMLVFDKKDNISKKMNKTYSEVSLVYESITHTQQ